ncbi:hypothetical protein PR048_026243 [Dryococelus australis]|uniref:Uncharacterized protein n=1 Tax=Dryococelus australis TaxID=614101 RepID=A0ABQ9GKT6_9NEOP|nr:hypothetical protein PR048_026243 [Dryococelus australis]
MAVAMSGGPSLALASLTATYTDSEGEDDVDEGNEKSPNDSVHSAASAVATPPKLLPLAPPPLPPYIPQVAPLVSYHDDTVVSDEEGGVEGDVERRRNSTGVETEHSEEVQIPPEPTGIQAYMRNLFSFAILMNWVRIILRTFMILCGGAKNLTMKKLARVQKAEMDRREKEKKEKTKVEFVSGTVKRPGSGSGAEDEAKKRKSKWDQVGTVSSTVSNSSQMKPAGLLPQTSLTSNVTGTKGTVISAFGSLPRKRL